MLIECQGTFYQGLLVLILLCKSKKKKQILRAEMAILRQDVLGSKMYHFDIFRYISKQSFLTIKKGKVFKN